MELNSNMVYIGVFIFCIPLQGMAGISCQNNNESSYNMMKLKDPYPFSLNSTPLAEMLELF